MPKQANRTGGFPRCEIALSYAYSQFDLYAVERSEAEEGER